MFSREMNKILRQAQNDKKENRSLYIIEILKVKHLCYPLEGIIGVFSSLYITNDFPFCENSFVLLLSF